MDIVKMFRSRDEVFHTETKKILDDIAPVITGATDFIDDMYGTDGHRELVWEGVNLIEGVITLVGVVSYSPGTQLMVDDEMMDITEDNHEYFHQMIRIGVPMDIAISESSDVVYTYLVNLNESEERIAAEEQAGVLSDFDLSVLSDDQRELLEALPEPQGRAH